MRDYIPRRNADFYIWQGNVVDLTTTNKAAWQVPDAAVTALAAKRAIYEPLYDAIKIKGSRTPGDVIAHQEGRATYERYIRTFVAEHLEHNSNITDDERRRLGINVRKPRSPRDVITTTPMVEVNPIKGGKIQVVCWVESDASRASKHPAANYVECLYALVAPDGKPPAGWEDCTKTAISPKARFILSFTSRDIGKTFYGYFRWLNTTDQTKSGPYTTAQTMVIS